MSWTDNTRPTPCYKCKDRQFGCHSKCKSYIDYRSELDGVIEKRLKNKKIDDDFFGCDSKTKYAKMR